MKKIASILILVFALSFSANAQKRGGKKMKNDFTVAQQATLAVKKNDFGFRFIYQTRKTNDGFNANSNCR